MMAMSFSMAVMMPLTTWPSPELTVRERLFLLGARRNHRGWGLLVTYFLAGMVRVRDRRRQVRVALACRRSGSFEKPWAAIAAVTEREKNAGRLASCPMGIVAAAACGKPGYPSQALFPLARRVSIAIRAACETRLL